VGVACLARLCLVQMIAICQPGLQLLLYNDDGGGRRCRAALLPEVEEQAALPELLQRVEPEAGAAELDLAADTAQAASSQLAARQGEALECVTQELLCNPEILRCVSIFVLMHTRQSHA
jgi:hypothetical protein